MSVCMYVWRVRKRERDKERKGGRREYRCTCSAILSGNKVADRTSLHKGHLKLVKRRELCKPTESTTQVRF